MNEESVEFLVVVANEEKATLINLSQVKRIFINGENIILDLGGDISENVRGEDAKALLRVLAERSVLVDGSSAKNLLFGMDTSMDKAIAKRMREEAEAADQRVDQEPL